jgi:hypothetical protein
MAEYVKWRFTRIRTGVTMALFGLLAGLGIRAAADDPPSAPATVSVHNAASTSHLKVTKVAPNSITSAQVKTHSLLLSDFKIHQVASYSSLIGLLLKEDTLKTSVSKISDAVGKIELAEKPVDISGLETQADANTTFLHKSDTAQNALKIDGLDSSQIVQGHGQVITGNLAISGNAPSATALSAPGLFDVTGAPIAGNPSLVNVGLTNTSGQTLLVNGAVANQTEAVAPGQLLPAVQMGDGSVKTLLVVIQGGTQAITVNLSTFASGSGGHTLVGQALVGSP